MTLTELRLEIDRIDSELVSLFSERMDISAKVAEYKKEHGLPVFDPVRESEKLDDIASHLPEEKREYARRLYSLIFELSRKEQSKLVKK